MTFDIVADYQDFLLPIALLILFLVFFVSFALYVQFKLKKKAGQVDRALKVLEKNDPIWRKEKLITYIDHYIEDVTTSWSDKDRVKLKDLLTENFYEIRSKKLDKMDEVGQRNVIDNIQIQDILLVDVQDYTDDELDRFTARIKYLAVNFTKNFKDQWEEPRWDEDVDPNPEMEAQDYIEFWTFLRQGKGWKLAKIEKEWKEGDYTDRDPVLKDEKYMPVEDI
jgi:predicted lipid-binding transport protein (Tim44 family)